MSGKTTMAKRLVKQKREMTNRGILVLDPCLDPEWGADYLTDDKAEFLRVVKENRSCDLVIDESGETIGRYAKEMAFLATRSRHYGHTSTFIAQRAAQIDRNVRDQCTTLILFSVYKADAQSLAETFNDDLLLGAAELEAGGCFIKERFKPARKINIFK